jgi:plastocyanin
VPGPAPKQDRVGFPKDYQSNYKLFFVFDRPDNKQVRVVCGNDQAVSVKPGEAYPYGSILVMETWRTKEDAQGNVVKDARGHYVRESLAGVFVMRKEQGFGADYQNLRTGEWEYVAYRPDGTYLTKPEGTFSCAACHLAGSNKESDWVFREDLFFKTGRYGTPMAVGPNGVLMSSIAFNPRRLKVKVGTSVTWVNADAVEHTVVMQDGSLASPVIKPGDSFTYTFSTTGVFTYSCGIHPKQMSNAVIEVTN